MKENLIQQKSYDFALKIIALYRKLVKGNEYVLSKQLLRSGTSIGANVEEAQAGQSRADFISKMAIASKEAILASIAARQHGGDEMGNAETLKRDLDLLPSSMITEVKRLVKKLKLQCKNTGKTKHLLSELADYSIDDKLPSDLAEQHDHYLYGVPNK